MHRRQPGRVDEKNFRSSICEGETEELEEEEEEKSGGAEEQRQRQKQNIYDISGRARKTNATADYVLLFRVVFRELCAMEGDEWADDAVALLLSPSSSSSPSSLCPSFLPPSFPFIRSFVRCARC